jgi:hypothetical protein
VAKPPSWILEHPPCVKRLLPVLISVFTPNE